MTQPEPEYSATLDVYYPAPVDVDRERDLTALVETFGGWFLSQLPPTLPPAASNAVWLTYAFSDMQCAKQATAALQQKGEYVEGPYWC